VVGGGDCVLARRAGGREGGRYTTGQLEGRGRGEEGGVEWGRGECDAVADSDAVFAADAVYESVNWSV